MPAKQGVSTVKKNIKKESNHYFVSHATHRFIQELSKKDKRPIGTYLDILIEREARKVLTADQVEAIMAESEQKEAERRREAEQMLQEKERAAG